MKEISLANEIIEIFESSNRNKNRYVSEIEWVESWRKLWVTDRIRVGVVGVTSSGKSTLINAILGDDLLSVAVRPSSSQLVSCSYAKERGAKVYFLNRDKKILKNDSKLKESIIQYSDEGYNKKNQKQVAQLELSTPSFDLGEDVLLVDSPGLDATGYEMHEKLTLETLLPTVDVVIFVTTVKSEVDKKMKQTLDVIAKYNVPLMIVQNMLDAVRPSVDGRKSASDVAKERLNRVFNAVEQSKIVNKEDVRVTQISAISAMEYRCHIKNDEVAERKYKQSRYSEFVSGVKELISCKRPEIEDQRVKTIITRIEELIKQEDQRVNNIKVDSDKDLSIEKIIPNIKNEYDKTHRSIENVLQKLDDMYREYFEDKQETREKSLFEKLMKGMVGSQDNLTEEDIKRIKDTVKQFEKAVVDNVQTFTDKCKSYIEKLKLPARDMWSYNGLPRMPEAEVKTKTVQRSKTVKKPGVVRSIFRAITFGIYKGEEVVHYTETIIDEEATRESVRRYIERLVFEYGKTLESWDNNAKSTMNTIQQEVELRIKAYKEKEEQLLDINEWIQTRKRLEKCISKYQPKSEKKKARKNATNKVMKQSAEIITEGLKSVKPREKVMKLYEVSQKYIYEMHVASMRYVLDVKGRDKKNTVIVSNSQDNLTEFLQRYFDIKGENFVKETCYKLSKTMQAVCAPSRSQLEMLLKNKDCNVFLIINGLQFHTEFETGLRKQVLEVLSSSSALYLVVQDFEVLANGNAISESIRAIKMEQSNYQVGKNGLSLISHSNPVYNMAFVHSQLNDSKIKEETIVYNDLMDKFPALVDENVKKRINNIMRA